MRALRLLPERWKERLRRRAGAVTLCARLENLRRAGFNPQRIVDAGAYRGEWTNAARAVFSSAASLLIEPQPELAATLETLCRRLPNTKYRRALLGAKSGTARFLLAETNSRIVGPDAVVDDANKVQNLPVETLESVCSAEGFAPCDLLKLDLQGHELEALAGASNLFGSTEVIITEVSWLKIGPVPLLSEVIAAFGQRGYQPYDIWGFNYRPRDRALWQSDIMFVRANSPLLASQSWN